MATSVAIQRRRWSTSKGLRYFLGRAALYAIICLGAVVFAMPFLWMLSTAVTPKEWLGAVPKKWIPPRLEWMNYIQPWTYFDFAKFYRNTIFITVMNVIGVLVSASLVAFGFARIRFWGRNVIFLATLATMMLPGQVTLIPQYLLWSRLHAINTYWPLIVPNWLGSAAYDIFLLRQFYMTITTEYDDAARIDGCGWWGIYRRILLPMITPAIGVLAIINFSFNWNDFFGPLIYINEPSKYTVAIGLRLFQAGRTGETRMGEVMAMTIESMIPVLVAFFLAQRYFIQGIVISGVKG
ncbi:MAG: carbohydrate ABC transporter permease [Anaerolineae bacterium]